MTVSIEQEIRTLRAVFWSDRDPEGRAFAPLADAYRRSGDFRQAVELLNDGLDRHPDFAAGHVVLAQLYLEKGLIAEAELASRRALDLDAENTLAMASLAGVLEARGEAGAAEELLSRVEVLAPYEAVPAMEEVTEDPAIAALDDAVMELADLAPDEPVMELADLAPDEPVMELADLAPDEPVMELADLAPDEPVMELADLAPDEPVMELADLAPDEPVMELADLAPDEPVMELADLAPEPEPVMELADLAPEPEPVMELADLAPDDAVMELADLAPEPEPVMELADLAPDDAVMDLADLAPEPEPVMDLADLAPEPEPVIELADLAPEPEPVMDLADLAPEPEPVMELADLAPEPHGGGDEGLVTRTMADLYVEQGQTERALEVYRQLLEVSPGDEALRDIVRSIEDVPSRLSEPVVAEPDDPVSFGDTSDDEVSEAAWAAEAHSQEHDVDTPFAWTEEAEAAEEGPPIGDYFSQLLGWASGAGEADSSVSGEEHAPDRPPG